MPTVNRLVRVVASLLELLIVYDSPDNTTIPYLSAVADHDHRSGPC